MRSSGSVPILSLLLVLAAGCATTDQGLSLADEYYNLGNSWLDQKKYDQAGAAYEKALRWNPQLRAASINWARAKADAGDAPAALKLLAAPLAADPDNLGLRQYQAWLTAKATGPASAADLYLQLASRLPGDAGVRLNAGLCLKAAGRGPEALVELQAWKALDGKGPVGLAALAALSDGGDPAEAAAAWAAAASALAEGDAKRWGPLTSGAKAWDRARQADQAVASWKAALALPKADGQNRGEALFRLGTDLLIFVGDYEAGSQAVLDAWKEGYKDKAAWDALRSTPDFRFAANLEADLQKGGIRW